MSNHPELAGQTVVVIGGSSGIGLETARRARDEGAEVILTARDAERLQDVGRTLGTRTAAFDATDFTRLARFFDELPRRIDHVLVTGPGPYYAPLAEFDVEKARRDVEAHLLLPIQVARSAAGKVRPGGTLLFMGGTGGRRTAAGLAFISALTAASPALTKNLALELAPIRVNLIAAGFVDTPLSASLLGDQLEARRAELRETLPIRRVVGPADIAALAVHLMTNTAVTARPSTSTAASSSRSAAGNGIWAMTARHLLLGVLVATAGGASTGLSAKEQIQVQVSTSVGLELPVEGDLPSLAGASEWLNSPPLTAAGLRGKVVLVEFWTYTCINWRRQLPYVRAWAEKYRNSGLVVIGVHTPELSFERDLANVRQAVVQDGVTFPVAFDPAYATWNAYHNEYWPAFYFVDRAGRIRHEHFGEGDYAASEQVIRELLAEPAS